MRKRMRRRTPADPARNAAAVRCNHPVRSVPESIASILDERKDRTRLGLSKYAAEAAKRAAESDGNLVLSRNVCDVAAVGSSLWPEDQARETILNLGELGCVSAIDSNGRTICIADAHRDNGKRFVVPDYSAM